MSKKYTKAEIIEAIEAKFDSVKNYANFVGTSKANVYEKIGRQTNRFIRELHKNGITLEKSNAVINEEKHEISVLSDIEYMRILLEEKNKLIEEKDKRIKQLEEYIELLKNKK